MSILLIYRRRDYGGSWHFRLAFDEEAADAPRRPAHQRQLRDLRLDGLPPIPMSARTISMDMED